MPRKTPMLMVLAALVAPAAAGGDPMKVVNPGDLHWKPKTALPAGALGAVMNGDPATGSYDFVGRFPAAYTVPLHHHSNDAAVVMLHGGMRISRPGVADADIVEGGFFLLPGGMDYVARCAEPCTFLVHGEKPFDIIYADPKDDPRR